MTQKEQEIAIAKALSPDLTLCQIHHSYSCCNRKLLNYTSDLNAMHRAEKSLADPQITTFIRFLWEAMADSPEARIGTIHATAAQRAQAFLKTLGLWK